MLSAPCRKFSLCHIIPFICPPLSLSFPLGFVSVTIDCIRWYGISRYHTIVSELVSVMYLVHELLYCTYVCMCTVWYVRTVHALFLGLTDPSSFFSCDTVFEVTFRIFFQARKPIKLYHQSKDTPQLCTRPL